MTDYAVQISCISDLRLLTTLVVVQSLSHVRLFETPQPVAYQIPLSMKFSRHLIILF